MTIYTLIDNAIHDHINIRVLLMATGLNEPEFHQYYNDELFTSDQIVSLKQSIKEWREGLG